MRIGPAAIVVVGTPSALAAKRQTTTIPVIMAPAGDPLGLGLGASLARPGGNVTGVTLYGSELTRKRMESLHESSGIDEVRDRRVRSLVFKNFWHSSMNCRQRCRGTSFGGR